MRECNVFELKEKLKDPSTILIDVREFPEFSSGRVPKAKLISLGEIENRHKEIDLHNEVYVICRSGKRSSEAQRKLNSLGFNNVINVKGGTEAWKSQNFPLEKDENAVWDLERQVRFVAGLLVFSGVVLATFAHPYLIVLSGFVGAGLMFSALTNTCGMGLILAKMPWNKNTAK